MTQRTAPAKVGMIVIAAVLAAAAGIIVGITTTHSNQRVHLSSGEACDSATPSASGAASGDATVPAAAVSHIDGASAAPGEAADPSAAPGDSAEPSAAPGDSAVPSAAPGDSAAPSAAPGDSAQPSAAPSDSAPPCDNATASPGGGGGEQGGGQAAGGQPQAQPVGPAPQDFIDIRKVRPNVRAPRPRWHASRGTFSSRCGRNENLHRNNANLVITPGVADGAHHLHDLVGNLDSNGLSTNESLAAAGTTCSNGDLSTYYWPVLRTRGAADDPTTPAVLDHNNLGEPVLPDRVILQYRGNPTSKVVAMPRFLRLIVGDAKPITNGLGNTRPTYTCTGFTNRITNKYPLCPRGSRVVSIHDFPSCWDGQNLDSANHRTHVVFPDSRSGRCPRGTRAVPQLRMVLIYSVPSRPLAFAVDGFATERHDPASDHAAYINVMPDRLMARAVACINRGRHC
ncbi:MAG TPA: DUF1996 domain-containing protein [Streptosporangiaceae bacterium]